MKDHVTIRGLVQASPAACKIFLTGEVLISRCGELSYLTLHNANDTVDEPLFVYASSGGELSIRMTRFDAGMIWPMLGTELLLALVASECERLGVPTFTPQTFDFYEALFEEMSLFNTYTQQRSDTGLYLNALTLFRKPLHGDLHASTFFLSAPSLALARATMTESMLADRDEVWDKSKQRLTNDELEFLVNVC